MDETRQENLDISIHRAKCSITLKDVMVQRTAMPHTFAEAITALNLERRQGVEEQGQADLK